MAGHYHGLEQMDASILIAPLIGLIAPIVITAIRRPASRIQERTKRLQYWKTFFELAPLSGNAVSDEAKRLCVAELAAAEDETRNLSNKLVSFITTVCTVAVMVFILWLLELASMYVLDMMRWTFQHEQPPQITQQQFKDATEQLRFVVLILQALIMCVIWFWVRWRMRDFVWNHLRPGKTFHFLLSLSDRGTAITEFIVSIIFALPMWLLLWQFWQLLISHSR
jgi:hypothetical protein